MQVVWLKRDLRLRDHEPLAHAMNFSMDFGPVVLLYVHEPSLMARPDFAAQHAGFINETLAELSTELEELGGRLLQREGEAVEVLDALWQQCPFNHLWAYQETTTLDGFARDKAVAAWCRSKNVVLTESPQNAVRRGREYREKGFSFNEHLVSACEETLWQPSAELPFAKDTLPSWSAPVMARGHGQDKPGRLKGGKAAAQAHLQSFFCIDALLGYPNAISSPNTAVEGCSRLSPYLAFGVLSDREVIQHLSSIVAAAEEHLLEPDFKELHDASRFYLERLYWRSAYLQSMELRPSAELHNDLKAFDGVREAEMHEPWFEAWKEGRTGFPMVDAVMRMLAHTGWTNMRARGMVASFAVNDLWLPWQPVGLHLAREFLDYEPGIHWSQMSIHSGTSRLSGPLTYNVVKQAQDHDPKGTFVRKWVPELAYVPREYLFEPWKMPSSVQATAGCYIGQHYPVPLVPYLAANEAARERVLALREGRVPPNSLYWKTRDEERFKGRQNQLF